MPWGIFESNINRDTSLPRQRIHVALCVDTASLRQYNSIGVAEVAEWQTRYVQGVVLERV